MADIPTVVAALLPQRMSVTELEARLRCAQTPIVARIKDGRLLLDPRTLTASEEAEVVSTLAALAAPSEA
jgi:L-seryl-tRNA(Ser) seleniumtransferase